MSDSDQQSDNNLDTNHKDGIEMRIKKNLTTTPSLNQVEELTESKKDLLDRLRQAQMAMQGPERFVLNEQRELESKIKNKEGEIKNRLAEISKLKESLEINWVALDNKRTALRKILDPILKEEEEVELEEDRLEGEERITPLPEERRKIEMQRWIIQEKRRNIEQKKMGIRRSFS